VLTGEHRAGPRRARAEFPVRELRKNGNDGNDGID